MNYKVFPTAEIEDLIRFKLDTDLLAEQIETLDRMVAEIHVVDNKTEQEADHLSGVVSFLSSMRIILCPPEEDPEL